MADRHGTSVFRSFHFLMEPRVPSIHPKADFDFNYGHQLFDELFISFMKVMKVMLKGKQILKQGSKTKNKERQR
jgi:hypothetical protein